MSSFSYGVIIGFALQFKTPTAQFGSCQIIPPKWADGTMKSCFTPSIVWPEPVFPSHAHFAARVTPGFVQFNTERLSVSVQKFRRTKQFCFLYSHEIDHSVSVQKFRRKQPFFSIVRRILIRLYQCMDSWTVIQQDKIHNKHATSSLYSKLYKFFLLLDHLNALPHTSIQSLQCLLHNNIWNSTYPFNLLY